MAKDVYEKVYKRAQDRNSAIRKLKTQGYKHFEEEDTEDGFSLKATKAAPKKALKIKAEEPDAAPTPAKKPAKKTRKKKKGDPVKAAKKAEKAAKAAAEAEEKTAKKTTKKPVKKTAKKTTKKTAKKTAKPEKTTKKKKGKKAEKKGESGTRPRRYTDGYWTIKGNRALGAEGEKIKLDEDDYVVTVAGVLVRVLKDKGDGYISAKYLWAGIRSYVPRTNFLELDEFRKVAAHRKKGLEPNKFKKGDYVVSSEFPKKRKKVIRAYMDCAFLSGNVWVHTGTCRLSKKSRKSAPEAAPKKTKKTTKKPAKKTTKKKRSK
jgi:cell wall-associated NlpC family hydrolase